MDRRVSERVQFFQSPARNTALPAGVFGLAHANAVLGLLLDLSDDGVQMLTYRAKLLAADTYKLIVHVGAPVNKSATVASVRRLWSKEGELYVHHGFAFAGDVKLTRLLDCVMDARAAGKLWLRCALMTA